MALFYHDKPHKKAPKTPTLHRFSIQDLDYQGLGIAKAGGKTWFVENALPTEVVEAKVIEEKRQYGRATGVKILQPSAQRTSPFCPIYSQCGGCQGQHIALSLQREAKQNALFRRLQGLQKTPIDFQPMIVGEDRHYRRRAKLSLVMQNGKLVMGFRQAQSQAVIPVTQCDVLTPTLNKLLPKLDRLFAHWKQKKSLGHIELVEADNGVALLLRHLGNIGEADRVALYDFAEAESLLLFVMKEKDHIEQWRGETPFYQIEGLQLRFSVRDFIQINASLNQKMVAVAKAWLALEARDRVLDLFCGMGNFTLPFAKIAKSVVGVEGVAPMVAQAQENAKVNQIANAEFYQTNLDEPFIDQPWAKEAFNKVLLDPARNGAYFALDHLCQLNPERIVYVSCNPATLVRDAEKLISQGYQLQKSAMIDMFPHTGHLESISLFLRK
ncbi:23S rRNA methyltransferase [Pasteurellaceae bacterium Macca]|nr:23S rRNA methyltransferase [Pasteurellaceae bacterium Macca]